jgi:hypothetical protein
MTPAGRPKGANEKAGRDERRLLRERLAAANGAKIEERRGLPDGRLWQPLDSDWLDEVSARRLEIEAKIRHRFRTGRKPSSESVAQNLNSVHRLGLTETYVNSHREEWAPFKIAKGATEKLGALRHSQAVRLVLATGVTP